MEKFSNDLAAEYDSGAHVNHGMEQTPRIAVRCLLPGFVSTKMSRMRPSMYVPGATAYVRHSLLSLGCHCGCRVARGWPERRRSDGTGQHGDGVGWLASASAAVFDSPSSPFSVGCPGVGTTGYTLHTVMVSHCNASFVGPRRQT